MDAVRVLLAVLLGLLVRGAEPRCSPTSYYQNCWIRRLPGLFVDVEASLRRGARLLRYHREESALRCSRTCCLTRNFSCNLAVFHSDAIREHVNCFHAHCPAPESCVLGRRRNAVLYYVTKGVDPDLLVFGKNFPSNVHVSFHHSWVNSSEQLPSDKRHFLHPPPPVGPPTSTVEPSTPSSPHPSSSPTPPVSGGQTSAVTLPPFSALPISPVAEGPARHRTAATSPGPMEVTQNGERHPKATEVNVTPNWTAGGGEEHGPELPAGMDRWVATDVLLVAVAILMGCCCCYAVLLAAGRRGRRERTGRCRSSWRRQRGAKYALGRESS